MYKTKQDKHIYAQLRNIASRKIKEINRDIYGSQRKFGKSLRIEKRKLQKNYVQIARKNTYFK